ncbi:MAG: hypothetical protein OXC02_01405 [Rhodobacteraceae bacterium]|nr:hypothetical protein [Paracoccaceae bacterium]
MFRELKYLLLVGILFYGINVGVAQGQQQQQGQAYEFSGLSRFIAPSQRLFGNYVWGQAEVFNGYYFTDVTDLPTECKDELNKLNSFIVLLQEDNTKWWSKPIYNYEVIPKNQKLIDDVIKNTNGFILDPEDEFSNDCDSADLKSKKFVVNSIILDELSKQ